MKKTLAALGLLSILAVAVGEAGADDKGDGKKKFARDPGAIFQKMDANNDGKVTKEEFKKAADRFGQGKGGDKAGQFADRFFDKLDANSDGALSKDELKKLGEGAGQFKGKIDPEKLKELLKKKKGGKE